MVMSCPEQVLISLKFIQEIALEKKQASPSPAPRMLFISS